MRLKCESTREETRFRLSVKRTSSFKSEGASFQLTTGSQGVRISDSNAGYTMFRGSVKGTGYPLHSPVSPSLPLPCRHRVPPHFSWTLPVPPHFSWTLPCRYLEPNTYNHKLLQLFKHSNVQTALDQTLRSTSCSAGTSYLEEKSHVLDTRPVPHMFQ